MRLLPVTLAAILLAASAQAQTLRIALREDPDQLDPTLARSFVGRIVFAGLCDKLFDVDEKLAIVPQLATGYEWQDPRTLILHLREGVKFQDGEDMDAASVVFSLQRHLTMPGSFRRSEIGAMDHAEAVDPHTVKVVLKTPSAPFVAQLADRAGMIVAPEAARKAGDAFGQHPVCAGPFSFVERSAQDHITLQRFPGYWDARDIHVDRVVYQILVDSSVRLANLQSGTSDIVENIQPTDVAAVKADPKLRLVASDALGYQGITFNVAHGTQADTPLGHDPRVRQAFALSLDRAALNQVVYNGMYVPNAQGLSPDSPFYDKAIGPGARDLARAKALLQAAGARTPVRVDLIAPTSPDIQQVAQVVQSMAGEAGFDVHITAMEFASSLNAAQAGGFQAYLLAWSGRVDPDGNLYSFLHTGGAQNYGAYSSAVVDKALSDADLAGDQAARHALYDAAQGQVAADLPVLYLWTPRNLAGMSARVQGYRAVPDGLVRLQGLSLAGR